MDELYEHIMNNFLEKVHYEKKKLYEKVHNEKKPSVRLQ